MDPTPLEFEFPYRWDEIGREVAAPAGGALDEITVGLLDERDRDLEDFLTALGQPQTIPNLVATYDSSDQAKAHAAYECDGDNDQEQINQAIADNPSREVFLAGGNYFIEAPIQPPVGGADKDVELVWWKEDGYAYGPDLFHVGGTAFPTITATGNAKLKGLSFYGPDNVFSWPGSEFAYVHLNGTSYGSFDVEDCYFSDGPEDTYRALWFDTSNTNPTSIITSNATVKNSIFYAGDRCKGFIDAGSERQDQTRSDCHIEGNQFYAFQTDEEEGTPTDPFPATDMVALGRVNGAAIIDNNFETWSGDYREMTHIRFRGGVYRSRIEGNHFLNYADYHQDEPDPPYAPQPFGWGRSIWVDEYAAYTSYAGSKGRGGGVLIDGNRFETYGAQGGPVAIYIPDFRPSGGTSQFLVQGNSGDGRFDFNVQSGLLVTGNEIGLGIHLGPRTGVDQLPFNGAGGDVLIANNRIGFKGWGAYEDSISGPVFDADPAALYDIGAGNLINNVWTDVPPGGGSGTSASLDRLNALTAMGYGA